MPLRSKPFGVRPVRTLRSRPGAPTSHPAVCGSRSWSSTGKAAVVTRPTARIWISRGTEGAAVRARRPPAPRRSASKAATRPTPRRSSSRTCRCRRPASTGCWPSRSAAGRSRRSEPSWSRSGRPRPTSARPRPRRRRRLSPRRRSTSCRPRACRIAELYRSSVADALADQRAVRRRVRDAEVLHEPHLRPGRGRRQRCAPRPRRLGHPLHPRRDLQGQRSRQGREPVGDASGSCPRSRGSSSSARTARCATGSKAPSRSESSTRPCASTCSASLRSFRRFPAGQTDADGVEAQARARGRPCRAPRQAAARARRGRRRRRQAGDPRGRQGVPARARGARHDLREARPAALVAAGPPAGRLHRGARRARRRRAAVPVRGGAQDHRRGHRPRRLRPARRAAARLRLDRAGPRRAPPHGPRGRRQGAAAGDRGAGRARPGAAALARPPSPRGTPRRPGSSRCRRSRRSSRRISPPSSTSSRRRTARS